MAAKKTLTYSIKPHGPNHCVVSWTGIAGYDEGAILDKCLNEVRDQPAKIVVIDMAQVEYLGSAGLGMLVALHRNLHQKQGELRLARVPDLIREVVTLAALDQVFHVHTDMASALA